MSESTRDEALDYPQIEALCGLKRRTIFNLVKKGKFPAPVRIGDRRVFFMRSAIDEYLRSRPTNGLLPKLRKDGEQ